MTFTRELVESELHTWANRAHPMEWIFANQDGDRPPPPYGTILVSSFSTLGHGEIESEEAAENMILERVRSVLEIAVSFQAFGSTAFDAIEALKTYSRRPSATIGHPSTVLLGLLTVGGTRDLSSPVAAHWDRRAQADLTFSARFNADLLIDTIGSVAVTGAGTKQLIEVP